MTKEKKFIERAEKLHVPHWYDLCSNEIEAMREHCRGSAYELMSLAFNLGFIRGVKAKERGRA